MKKKAKYDNSWAKIEVGAETPVAVGWAGPDAML